MLLVYVGKVFIITISCFYFQYKKSILSISMTKQNDIRFIVYLQRVCRIFHYHTTYRLRLHEIGSVLCSIAD